MNFTPKISYSQSFIVFKETLEYILSGKVSLILDPDSMIFSAEIIVKVSFTGDETEEVFAVPVIVRGSESITGRIGEEDCSITYDCCVSKVIVRLFELGNWLRTFFNVILL